MMMFLAVCFACLALSSHAAAQISFRASPQLVIETVNDDFTLECKIPAAITDVYMGIMVMIKQTSSGGDTELLNVLKASSDIEKTGGNRTEAEANLKNPDGEDASTFLRVKVLEPVSSDTGTYECQILYLDNAKNLQNVVSSVDVNVTAVPPPNYVPQETSSCECEEIWAEINNLKASVGSGVSESAVAAPASACQVSFTARFESRSGYQITDGETAVFDATTTNKGDAYDVSTGEFTAPCDGQYYFSVALRSQQDLDAGYVDGVIMADGVAVVRNHVEIQNKYR
ncbi:hypothetical protein ElyMa_005671600 [Elysia marginata]|uniref:C1q domain-containing protein n=1 Tax=Elysia marginata TaxID=1093978 RepID=A0AAV4FD02_9GAST|nr:hypothetical protein ElyMa_005671600 [Elysia marginata]